MKRGLEYIAHPGQTLEDHLLGVATKAGTFAAKIGLSAHGELIGLLHDLGKYSKDFQTYIKSAVGQINPDEDEYVDASALKGKVDHSTAGAQYVWEALAGKGPWELRTAQILSLCIASHHSGLLDCLDLQGEDTFSRRMRKAKDKTHLDEVKTVADSIICNRVNRVLADVNLADAIKQLIAKIARTNTVDNKVQSTVTQLQIGLAVRFLFSCLIDADRIDTADFERKRTRKYMPSESYVSWPVLVARFERHLALLPKKHEIDELRQEISSNCLAAASRKGGIFTLSVPTGGGKTLASLRFALHHAEQRKLDRVIYVIPFTSIIDQNAQVVRAILEPDDAPNDRGKIVLEHHANLTPEQQTWREKILCENWDAPVIYTTMVQFLESLFGAGTRGARRMHQLANSVLIFDEIQTLPVKCVHLFNNAINFLAEHCNSTVVLCTATQPLLHEVDYKKGAVRLAKDHEIMPNRKKLFDELKRVEVRDRRMPGGWTYDEVANLALQEVSRTGNCLVIVNTKRAAREVFNACQEHWNNGVLAHLSTDMCPAHRKYELRKIKQNLDDMTPVLCVSTQLIEAGVDVDFRTVIRFVSGLDSIAQAAGRCNRNGSPEPGTVHVVNPVEDRLGMLPDIAIGRDVANRLLDDYGEQPERFRQNLFGIEALNDYYHYYFFERQREMSYPLSAKSLGRDDTLLNVLSSNSLAVSECQRNNGAIPDRLLNQSFMAAARVFKAIDAPTQGVIVPYGERGHSLITELYAAYNIELEIELLREAQQYTVNVFPNIFDKLKQAVALNEIKHETCIYSLDSRFYSPDFGLATEPVALMETLYVGTS